MPRAYSPDTTGEVAVPTVETVRGPVDVDDLGPTLMHEHIFVLATEHVQNYGEGSWWDEEERVADAVIRLNALRAKGIKTIVDPTVWGLGRYIPRIQRIAAQVDLNVIVATGLYAYSEQPLQYAYRGPGLLMDIPEPMVTDFTRDLVDGIATTGVKAAFLKCCVETEGLTPGVERILRAVAHTHLETGAPITVHTSGAAQTGRQALQLFAAERVDLTKVVVGHAGDSNDLDYLMELADTGAILGMDRFGLDLFNPTADRVQTIAALAERGYADRMVLAHDANCYIDYFGAAHDAARTAVTPNWHYEFISDDVLPALREAGVSDGQLDQMLVEVPRTYFSGRKP
jgi:phosphotriesterase-related protein